MLLRRGIENKEYWFVFPGIDKLIHLSIFAFLGFTLLMSFRKLNLIYFLGIIFIYGLGTEILQEVMHMGRSFELLDILADIVGSLLGLITYRLLLNFFSS